MGLSVFLCGSLELSRASSGRVELAAPGQSEVVKLDRYKTGPNKQQTANSLPFSPSIPFAVRLATGPASHIASGTAMNVPNARITADTTARRGRTSHSFVEMAFIAVF